MKIPILSLTAAAAALTTWAAPSVVSPHIHIDQFGYVPGAAKVAVLADPQTGFNSALSFTPGISYEVRRWSDDVAVFAGSPAAWNSGATHVQSGDKVWWFDFSSLAVPGTYYIYDVSNALGSHAFTIADTVFHPVLRAAVRALYYQRCGTPKTTAHAGAAWSDAACHGSTGQDFDCRLYNNTALSTSRNLQGGWHDAGDYNKYVTFAYPAVKDLLLAYEENSLSFTDDYNLPESGNGIPDVLDEVKWEIDWLRRMQASDGSVLSVVGGGSASPPSADTAVRRYGPATTAATLAAAAMFALGARQYKSLGIPAMTAYGDSLEAAAENAWTWAVANPSVTFYNSGVLAAGEQEPDAYGRDMLKLAAASYLYVATGTAAYKTYLDANYTNSHLLQWSYAYPFEGPIQDALLYYTKASGAAATVSSAIKTAFANSVHGSADNYAGFTAGTDAYRAHLISSNYTWGSNSTKSTQGSMGASMAEYSLGTAGATAYSSYAASYLHYLHGVNPLHTVYLSNAGSFGADSFAREFYHAWAADGSALYDRAGVSTYGPMPGFLTGGANPSYNLDGCCAAGTCAWTGDCGTASVTPPLGQPAQKSYRDWNTSWPQNSWSVTENSNVYQGAYIRLLSKFSSPPAVALSVDGEEANTPPCPGSARGEMPVWTARPNPTRDLVYLLQPGSPIADGYTYAVHDALGRTLLTAALHVGGAENYVVDLRAVPAGLYSIAVHDAGGFAVGRLRVIKE